MSFLGALRDWATKGAETPESCFGCAHFCDDPARIEAALPGLAALSSAHAYVRAQDGLCLAFDHVINGRRRCAAFSPQGNRRDVRAAAIA